MPRIPSRSLNCVGYLYHSTADAEAGADFGGTAFFVSVPSTLPNRHYIYAVTNWHVACRDGASVLRVNRKDGDTDIFDIGPEQWDFDARYDIAVVHIPLTSAVHTFSLVQAPNAFVKKEDIEREKLGVGEDVFMVGRFVDHDGGPINRPAVRFGHISVMPAPIEQPNGKLAESYCIDLHSRSGYSGSPVFVYRTPGYDLEEKLPSRLDEASILFAGANYLALLGIHFAQFPEQWEIEHPRAKPQFHESRVPLIEEGRYVKGLSGMTCILPAWLIWDVLNLPKLVAQRAEADARNLEKGETAGQSNDIEPEASS